MVRSNEAKALDKTTFTEYTQLPGIINDRLHFMFSNFKMKYADDANSNPKQKLAYQKKEDFVTLESFVRNFVRIFLGDLDSKIKFTFEMYDFDNDGYVTAEDVRIMMSYMPLSQNVTVHAVQALIDQRGLQESFSPRRAKEGLYEEEEGKNQQYEEHKTNHEEIKIFVDSLFEEVNGGKMNFEDYVKLTTEKSSEMFYSLMATLHERLPCSKHYFRMRRKFKESQKGAPSPVRQIASPRRIRGWIGGFSPKTIREESAKHETDGFSNALQNLKLQASDVLGAQGNQRVSSPHKMKCRNKMLKKTQGKSQERKSAIMSPMSKQRGIGIRLHNMQSFNFTVVNPHNEVEEQNLEDSSPSTSQNKSRKSEVQQENLIGFGNINEGSEALIQSECLLKTKSDKFKSHWAVIIDKELFCYRKKSDVSYRIMHSLAGTFVQEMAPEYSTTEGYTVFGVKIILPPNKSRILFFKQVALQK